jgi:hemolysin activation/secretion protein
VPELLRSSLFWAGLLFVVPAGAAVTQTPQDRADPSVIEQDLRDPRKLPSGDTGRQLAVDPRDPGTALERPIAVRSIRLIGASALPASAYAPVILPYKNRTLGGAELQDLATAVAEAARRSGYGLASAWIPEQTVEGGLLTVEVDEGRIDDVRVEGDAAAIVRPYLEPLATGGPVRTEALERALMLTGDLPGVAVGKPRIERVDGRTMLVVDVEYDPEQGRVSLDNWGSGTVGPVRAHLAVDFNGVLTGDDRLTIGGVVTPLDPEEFGLVRLAYSLRWE